MLTDQKIKSCKAKDKIYRIADTNGLALEITPKGVKHWRYRYRFNGKATMASLGAYPLISLAEARSARDRFKKLLFEGINPSAAKAQRKIQLLKQEQERKTFSDMFYEWHVQNSNNWSARHIKKVEQQGARYLLPYIGSSFIGEITPQELLVVFKTIEKTGALETLQKVRSHTSRVFRYSVGLGIVERDPTRDLPNDIFQKPKVKHYATITDPKEIGGLLRMLDDYQGSYQVAFALKIAPYLFLRPNELAGLRWDEIDFNDRIIRIAAKRMKMSIAHLVPLPSQVIVLLQKIRSIKASSEFVFPSIRNKGIGISPESLRAGLRRLGLDKDEFTTHGFRHMASTRLHELGFKGGVIERQLAHAEKNKVKAAYNHAEYLDERTVMMQEWADYLDGLKKQ